MKDEEFPRVDRYLGVVKGKTAALMATAVVSALEALGQPSQVCAQAEKASLDSGILFQIQDDLLDVYGEKARDRRATDIAEGKISVLIALLNDAATPAEREKVAQVLKTPRDETTDAQILEVIELLDQPRHQGRRIAAHSRNSKLLAVRPRSDATSGNPRTSGGDESDFSETHPPPDSLRRQEMQTIGFYQTHLDRVSRSFAFCIKKLESPLRQWVSLAYLLCRVLDTVEDSIWESPRFVKLSIRSSIRFCRMLHRPRPCRLGARDFPFRFRRRKNSCSPKRIFSLRICIRFRRKCAGPCRRRFSRMSAGMKYYASRTHGRRASTRRSDRREPLLLFRRRNRGRAFNEASDRIPT